MKIIALTTYSALPQLIFRRIHASHAIDRVIRVNLDPAWFRRKPTTSRFSPGRILRGIENRIFYPRLYARQDRKLRSIFEDAKLPLGPTTIDIDATKLNRPETAALIRDLEPDILLVCCSPILKPMLFNIAKIATLNIHFGIAPAYRGSNSLFWTLYSRDYANLGLTIHHIDDGVDTGPVILHAYLATTPSDNEITLAAKAGELAASAVLEMLESVPLFKGVVFPSNPAEERIYKRSDRRVWHDLGLFAQTITGRSRPPYRSARIVHYDQPAPVLAEFNGHRALVPLGELI